MKPQFAGILCTALMGVLCVAPAAFAQQKTIKECRAEWQANKAEMNYRSGIHNSMSCWYLERRNANASSHSNAARNRSGDRAADEFGLYGGEPYWRQPIRV